MIVLLLGCWPGPLPECPACAEHDDGDADGHTPAQGDCDDADPTRHPGAEEVCDGVDQDCDGAVDDGASDATPWYRDDDGDGWGNGESSARCDPGAGWSDSTGDCDDGDAAVNPEAAEVCDNGMDDDCDEDDGGCILTGTHALGEQATLLTGAAMNEGLGWSAVPVPDGGFWAGEPGYGATNAGRLLRLPGGGRPADGDAAALAVASIDAGGILDTLGLPLAATDEHLVARATGFWTDLNAGVVYLFDHDLTGVVDDPDEAAHARIAGADAERLGEALGAAPGGGLLLASRRDGVVAWWLPEPVGGSALVDDVGHALTGAYEAWGFAPFDADGDGSLDLAVGVPEREHGGRSAAGAVLWFAGPVESTFATDDTDALLLGPDAGAEAGGILTVLPDLDGDGRAELFVGAPSGQGDTAWLLDGGWSGEVDLDTQAWLRVVGETSVALGTAVAAPDLDADGAPDLAVSSPVDGRSGVGAGVVSAWYGPFAPGVLEPATAPLQLLGEGANHGAGTSMAATDLDGDGRGDLLVGAPGESSVAENSGGLYAWWGRGL